MKRRYETKVHFPHLFVDYKKTGQTRLVTFAISETEVGYRPKTPWKRRTTTWSPAKVCFTLFYRRGGIYLSTCLSICLWVCLHSPWCSFSFSERAVCVARRTCERFCWTVWLPPGVYCAWLRDVTTGDSTARANWCPTWRVPLQLILQVRQSGANCGRVCTITHDSLLFFRDTRGDLNIRWLCVRLDCRKRYKNSDALWSEGNPLVRREFLMLNESF